MPSGGTRRLFFALWPDPAVRAGIEDRRQQLPAPSKRAVPTHNLHATLVFLGNQPIERIRSIEMAGDRAGRDSTAFDLVLDRFGWFSRARAVWLGAEAIPGGRALVSKLHQALSGIDIETDARPWTPHVTLFRNVRRQPALPQPEPLAWRTTSFALIESIPNRPYQVLRTWSLQ
jgi:2'-5' RNA ligase